MGSFIKHRSEHVRVKHIFTCCCCCCCCDLLLFRPRVFPLTLPWAGNLIKIGAGREGFRLFTHLKYLACFERGTGQQYHRTRYMSRFHANHIRVLVVAKVRNLTRLVDPWIPNYCKYGKNNNNIGIYVNLCIFHFLSTALRNLGGFNENMDIFGNTLCFFSF